MKFIPKLLYFCWLPILVGCTLYPEKKPVSVQTTTSAEQYERLFWQMTKKQQWNKTTPLLATNVVWSLPGRTLHHDEVVTYLQQQQAKDYAVRDVAVQPNGADMTVTYTLDRADANGNVQRSAAVTVWQQLKSGWVMILHTEQPASSS